MNRIAQLFKVSIINKVIFLIALIILSIGVILAVNTVSFFNVRNSLELIIDRDVGQVIENTTINENLRNSIVVSDLLINTFTERENTLAEEKKRLIDAINADIRSLNIGETSSKKIFQEYINNLNKLFDQCAAINGTLKEINTTENSLDIGLSILDGIVVEKELIIAVEDNEEAESIKQLAIMLPGYREIFFEIIFEFINIKHAHLETNEINQKHKQKMLSLLEEFDIGLSAMPIAWAEIIPHVRNLMGLTLRYKSQLVKIFECMRKFNDRLGVLKLLEKQVISEISKINSLIINNTYAIRSDTSKNITSSIKTTIFLSSLIILILGVLGGFIVRLVQPIKRLSIGAGKIGAGDLSYKVDIDSNDEIGHLAESFNRMTHNLRETTVSKEYVQNILKSMNETLIVSTPQGTIQTVNHATCELVGYEAQELVGESIGKIFGGIEGGNITKKQFITKLQVEKSVQQQFIINTESTVLCKDGHEIPVLFSASAMLDKDENAQGIVCVAAEITERKRMEDELAAEKERLTVTLRSIGDGVIATDIQGKTISINKVAEELTGWKEEDAIGMPLTKVFYIVNEFNRQRCEDPVHKVMETGGVVGLANNTLLISKDGNEHVIADSGAPIRNNQNEIIGAVLVFRDITEKRKMEAELVNAQKLESLGVLAGGIAHDFNNFLTAIIGNLSLARLDAKPGDPVVTLLNEMEKASLKAKDLTQQLLTFSKGGEPVKKLVDLAELVKNSVGFSLRGSNVRCDFLISEDLLGSEIDEGQIGQVINNLVLNADQAMPEGGIIEICSENITLTADNQLSLPAGPYLKTSIRDHGVGIGPDHLAKVFDPYFTTKQKGSGLGLTVSYSIIDKHNGRLTVESELGYGTTFTIYLPASETAISQSVDEEARLFIGKGKILVMDDEEYIHEVAIQMLSKIGYEVSVANDGNEAIEIYRQARKRGKPFDLVIMDLTIPGGMGGKEAIQQLKKLDPNVKALVSSGYSNDPIMSNFRDYGFQGVVKKPYRIQDMSDALRSVNTIEAE